MIKRIVPIALLGATLFSLNACTSGGSYKKTENGIEYKIVKDEKGANAKVGDMVELHMIVHYMMESKRDTELFNSRKMNGNKPLQIPLLAPAFKGDFVEALMKLSAGDSALIRISVDSLKKQPGMTLPDFMKPGKYLEYSVVMLSVKSQDQMKTDADKHSKEQAVTDDKILQDYFAKNNLHPSKTASGLYYIVETPGSGENATNGKAVTVNYTGRTLDGNVFDSNTDPSKGHAEPFTFELGRGSVIPGWDEGVGLLKAGSKAKTLYTFRTCLRTTKPCRVYSTGCYPDV